MNQTKQIKMSDKDIVLRYTLVWFVMIFVAIFNAILREAIYASYLDSLAAHQLSSVTAVLLFFLVTWAFNMKWPFQSNRQAIIVGIIWVILTPIFEFSFGLFVMGHPLDYLLNDYNLLAGRVWGLVLLSILFIPLVVYKIRERQQTT